LQIVVPVPDEKIASVSGIFASYLGILVVTADSVCDSVCLSVYFRVCLFELHVSVGVSKLGTSCRMWWIFVLSGGSNRYLTVTTDHKPQLFATFAKLHLSQPEINKHAADDSKF